MDQKLAYQDLQVTFLHPDNENIMLKFNRPLTDVELNYLTREVINEIRDRIEFKQHQQLLNKKVGE